MPPDPVLGLILPPAESPVPPEATILYPRGIGFLAEGLAFRGMTLEGYDEAVPRIVPAALRLKARGATSISIMGTSITFYKGSDYNRKLIDQVQQATGLPATSMSSGIVDGLQVARARRVAVATAYGEAVNATLARFLEENGFEIAVLKGLNLLRATNAVSPERLYDFCVETYSESRLADALLICCGGLKTLDLVVRLEAQYRTPVVSSTPHGLMNAVRFLGLSPRVLGYGSVLSQA